jgi:hypothetical protein
VSSTTHKLEVPQKIASQLCSLATQKKIKGNEPEAPCSTNRNIRRKKFMMAPSLTEPEAKLSHLPRADGSVTFSYAGYTVIAAVNGPIEAPRRDENPSEAIIDVTVRPAAGVGGKVT